MSESAIGSLFSIVKLSVVLMGLIAIVALTRDRKSTKSFWEAIAKLFKPFL